MTHRWPIVEVVVRPRADGGCPSNVHQNKCLLAEVQYGEPVGDEVQASEEEGLGWLEDGRPPHPNMWECGKLQ